MTRCSPLPRPKPVKRRNICYICGRGEPETILNIESVIYHNCKYRCLDIKDCKKYNKKRIIK